ncbi:histone deacetylase [Asimina triloba]
MGSVIHALRYWLSDHPSIIGFRWSHSQSWGSTWSFLITSIAFYVLLSLFLHLVLLLFQRRGPRPVPLGPIPALHSLFMASVSLTIFFGTLFSVIAEIRETRWIWSRSKTPFQWLLCFPLGTRPTGRVFFWSYVFYLSRFIHVQRTFFTILRRRKLTFFRLFHHSILICMSFLWLEFSQSFQLLAILLTTLVHSFVYGYRFWIEIGMRNACFPLVANCHILLLASNAVCHVGVLMLHFYKGGCNGIGAWLFNSIMNCALLLLFLNFYVNMHLNRSRSQSQSRSRSRVNDDAASTSRTKVS